ncbi:dynein light intermediate chain-domain-containing protein [Melanogaster broomeanus]|nr:dynein light intermediate chain-domain-containing protein [Melanogaster broomeanus]
MEESRPSTPEAPPQDLWSSILDSVSSSRSTPSKQVLLLGQPSSGKSLLASALLQKSVSDESKEESRTDFALGYDWADVRDDGDEDTIARLSVYTVPSEATAYTALLPHFLPPRTALPHTLVMIVLDWTRPWTFMEDLQTWLDWMEQWVDGGGSREVEIVREENRERLQAHLQHYTEPSADSLPTTSNLTSNTVLPLGPGTLTHNSAGVPIIVVCTKADLIDEGSDLVGAGTSGMDGMVKGKGAEWEERTDGVMQVLRTIYGAALFYTTPQPSTLQVLRQYTLHLLFTPPAPSPGMAAGMEAPAPIRNPFIFHHRPNTLDRDRIVVPAGWDSWGKIGVLREGFEARMWGEAWDADLNADGSETEDANGAKRMYRMLVPDQGAKPPPLPPFNDPMAEQAFLAKHYDENAKKSDRDPRGAFRNPADTATAGIVGPLGSSSFSLPNVEKALADLETGMGGSSALNASVNGDASRRLSKASARPVSGLSVVGAPSATGRAPASPTLGSPPSSTGGQTQHEVLQNFFQSLLSSKDRTGASAAASRASGGPPPARTNGSPGGTDDAS